MAIRVLSLLLLIAIAFYGTAADNEAAVISSQWCWTKLEEDCQTQVMAASILQDPAASIEQHCCTNMFQQGEAKDCTWTNLTLFSPIMKYCSSRRGSHNNNTMPRTSGGKMSTALRKACFQKLSSANCINKLMVLFDGGRDVDPSCCPDMSSSLGDKCWGFVHGSPRGQLFVSACKNAAVAASVLPSAPFLTP